MNAHLYLMAESFSSNFMFNTSEIEEKVKRLAEDVKVINKYKETNKLYTNYNDIYPQIFYLNFTVSDFICRPRELRECGVDRDIINALQNILEKSESTNITSAEVREELFNWNDEENCHGLIAFHSVIGIENSFQVIYGIDSWYKFRRHFLAINPKNEEFYINECEKYFPNLTFHQRNKVTLKDIFEDFSTNVLKHLGYLNDVFYTYRARPFPNESVKYQTFSIECQLEEYAAPKDKKVSKEVLTFDFIDSTNQSISITCYPHLRLCRSDKSGDTNYYQNRIYFHEGIPTISKGNILIGHIGKHRK